MSFKTIGRVFILVIAASTLSTAALADSISLIPVDDVLVNSTKTVAAGKYADYYLSVYYDGAVYNRTYLKFDLTAIPDLAVITSAILTLTPYQNPSAEFPAAVVDLNRVAGDAWTEGTLLWSNAPAFDALPLGNSTPAIGVPQTFDLLASGGWIYSTDLSDNYLSLVLKEGESLSSTVKQTWYRQSEWSTSAERPSLNITYQPVPEPASLLLFGTGFVGMARTARRRMRK